jgi:putative transposase
MSMQRTVRLQLNPTIEQTEILLDTMKQYSECFNVVSRLGFEKHIKNGVTLHKETYYPLRKLFPELPSQLVCASRVKATEAIKSALTLQKKGKKVSCPTGQHVPIRYDARTYRMLSDRVSLASISGRQVVSFRMNQHAERWMNRATGFDSADLVYRKGRFFLHVVLTIPDVEFIPNGKAVGVDLGLNRPAVCSNKTFHGKKRWKEVDRRYFRLKRKLQSKGTKSAKKHLKRLSGKVNRFRLDCDHVISRRIVESVEPGTTIVVENLVDIRKRTKQRGRESRRRMHSWSFAQLRGFLEYKAEEKGCSVVGIDPRHTSQMCSRCGFVHRSNRSSQSVFKCRSCGYELNADLQASINIARKYLAGDGISVSGGLLPTSLSSQSFDSRDKPPALAVG